MYLSTYTIKKLLIQTAAEIDWHDIAVHKNVKNFDENME